MTAPPTNRGRTFDIEPLSPEEVTLLVRSISPRYASGARLRALIGVMYGGGLRIGEALALLPKDVDLDRCTIRVLNGKNGNNRLVGIDPSSCSFIATWMERRIALGLTQRHRVFATYSANAHGKPIGQRYVRSALASAALKAGLDKRVHPHGLRHSHAFGLAQRGTPTHQIQKQLGHVNLATTDDYVGHLANEEVVEAMRNQPAWFREG
ncbi:MAG: tyrosine-type recombinase/integrase [Frankiaceae bacterium]|nr:tyrosine-type recombinase/integrase [Frankiaceae bacterium]